MTAALVLLDVDPSIVRPGWIALAVTLFVAAALVLLYVSLRRQMRRISPDLPRASDGAPKQTGRQQARQADIRPPDRKN